DISSGVVDENVDPAEVFFALLDGRFDLLGHGDVARNADCVSPHGSDHLAGIVQALGLAKPRRRLAVDVVDDHVTSESGKVEGVLAAKAAPGSCNEANFSF